MESEAKVVYESRDQDHKFRWFGLKPNLNVNWGIKAYLIIIIFIYMIINELKN